MSILATERIPQPVVVGGVVSNDVITRTLVVKRPENLSGYQKLLWREAHQALVAADEAGWQTAHPYLWGKVGRRQIVHGLPGDKNLELLFHFPTGETTYKDLVSKPGLTAFVTLDRSTRRFMGVTFRNRRLAA